jgi:hypothetical protein
MLHGEMSVGNSYVKSYGFDANIAKERSDLTLYQKTRTQILASTTYFMGVTELVSSFHGIINHSGAKSCPIFGINIESIVG